MDRLAMLESKVASLQIWSQSCGPFLNGRAREIRSLGHVSPQEMRKGRFVHGEKGLILEQAILLHSDSLDYNIVGPVAACHSTRLLVTGELQRAEIRQKGKAWGH